MNPAALEALILQVLRESPEISPSEHLPEAVTVERPKNRDHGDYATNIALTLTKAVGKPPREIAEALAQRAAEKSWGLFHLAPLQSSLEDVFVEITRKDKSSK